MSPERQSSSRPGFFGRAVFVIAGLLTATLIILPATVFAQATPGPTPGAGTPTAAPAVAPAVATAVKLSAATGLAGASITLNGEGYKPTELINASFNGQPSGQRSEPRPQGSHVTLTAFYALDQERLDRKHWDLADVFAGLHDFVTNRTEGVARITIADLLLALEARNHLDDEPRWRQHRNAVRRIIEALGDSAQTVY